MTRDEQLHIFEQPLTQDSARLTCNHITPIPAGHSRDADGWHTAIHCPTCNRRRAVVSVIRPKEPRPAA